VSRRPGQRTPSARALSRPRATVDTGATPAVPSASGVRRPRLTGRAAVLILVLSVLTVSYASSLRAYLQQKDQIDQTKTQIAQRSAEIESLEREKQRWQDPAYVQAKARERFGYLMPGEKSYVVLDKDGKPIESQASLSSPQQVLHRDTKAWWSKEWESVQLAGNPSASR
jgi:cell division protein FtsB